MHSGILRTKDLWGWDRIDDEVAVSSITFLCGQVGRGTALLLVAGVHEMQKICWLPRVLFTLEWLLTKCGDGGLILEKQKRKAIFEKPESFSSRGGKDVTSLF